MYPKYHHLYQNSNMQKNSKPLALV